MWSVINQGHLAGGPTQQQGLMSRSLGRAESESEGEVESLEERIRSKVGWGPVL